MLRIWARSRPSLPAAESGVCHRDDLPAVPPGTPRTSRRRRELKNAPIMAAALVAVTVVLLTGAILLGIGLSPNLSSVEAIPTDFSSIRLYGEAKTQVDDLTVQAGYIQAEIDALDTELEKYSETYNELQVQLDEVNVQMATLRRELQEAQLDHAYRIKKVEDRLCALYKTGGRGNELLELLVSSRGIEDFVNRVRVAATLADQDERIVENLVQSTERLNTLLAQIDRTKREQLTIRRQVDDQRDEIQAALSQREAALAGIDTEISNIIEAERARQEEEQTRLQNALTALLNGGQIYNGPLPETDSEILNQFLETAAYYIGIPYVWAGDRPSTGFDCSGFTQFVYAQHGVSLPHYSGYQAQMGTPVSLEDIKAGDLVAFGFPVHHVGIYIGDDLFIHAPRTGDVVSISRLSERNNLAAIRRFELQPRTGAPAVW